MHMLTRLKAGWPYLIIFATFGVLYQSNDDTVSEFDVQQHKITLLVEDNIQHLTKFAEPEVDYIRDHCPGEFRNESNVDHLSMLLLKTEVDIDSETLTVLIHLLTKNSFAEQDITQQYCQLWRTGSSLYSGLVTEASIMTSWDKSRRNRKVTFVCVFPGLHDTSVPMYTASVVSDYCVVPKYTVKLAQATMLHTGHQNVEETIRRDSPPWKERAVFLFGNSTDRIKDPSVCSHNNQYILNPNIVQPPKSPFWSEIEPKASFVYSAYVDVRHKRGVLIKGFGLVNKKAVLENPRFQIYCQLYLNSKGVPLVAGVEVSDILSGRRLHVKPPKYRDVEYHCYFDNLKIEDLIDPVLSYVTDACSKPTSFVHLNVPEHPERIKEFTVCLSGSIRNKYDDYQRFVEWVELNIILGAQHFVMYDHEAGDELHRYMNHYKQKGILDVHDWHLPASINQSDNFEVWSQAQRILMNDCMYRHMYRTKYLVFIDFDEIIAPKQPSLTWRSMLDNAQCTDAAYTMAIHAIFRLDWPDDVRTKESGAIVNHQLNLLSLRKTSREDKIYPMNKRGKYIIKPTEIDLLLVHRPYPQDFDNKGPCLISPELGLLHHYREGLSGTDGEVYGSVRDRSLYQFADVLVTRASLVHNQINRH